MYTCCQTTLAADLHIYCTYTVRVCPYALLFKLPTTDRIFIINILLEIYIKIRGANLILVPMPSAKGTPMNYIYPETAEAFPQNERLILNPL